MTNETYKTLLDASVEATRAISVLAFELGRLGSAGGVHVCNAMDSMITAAVFCAMAQDNAVKDAVEKTKGEAKDGNNDNKGTGGGAGGNS